MSLAHGVDLAGAALTSDALLGGRLTIRQQVGGHRAGSDAVLLAAAVPAAAGDAVLEIGCGNGAAALCLANRVAGIGIAGLEIDPQAAELARQNAADNGLAARIVIHTGSIAAPPAALMAGSFDHVMMNPPFFAANHSQRPPGAARAMARVAEERSLDLWLRRAARFLRPHGHVTVILRVERLDELLRVSVGRFGSLTLFPLWPRPGLPAKRFLVQGQKGSRRALTLLPGLILHQPGTGSRYSPAAEAVLRHGAALPLHPPVT